MSARKLGDDAELVEFIHRHQTERGYSPSVRDIAAEYEMSHGAVQATMRRMFDEGLLKRPEGRIARAITISGAGMKLLGEEMK